MHLNGGTDPSKQVRAIDTGWFSGSKDPLFEPDNMRKE